MMDDFTSTEIQTGEVYIFVRSSGSGPPILLLHGHFFPEEIPEQIADALSRFFDTGDENINQ